MSVSFYTHILNDSGYILRKNPNELFGQLNIWREITGARFGLAEHSLTSPGYSPKKWSDSRILIYWEEADYGLGNDLFESERKRRTASRAVPLLAILTSRQSVFGSLLYALSLTHELTYYVSI